MKEVDRMVKNEPNIPDDTKTTPEGEPPAPFDLPAPGNVVVPFDKTRETAREAEQNASPEKQEAEKSDKAPNKRGRRGKAVQQEAKSEDTRKEPEEQRSEAESKKQRKPRATKQKSAAEKKAPAKAEAPVPEPEPEQPPEPKEAPHKGEQEQIVFINLSELHAFKNHPFQIRDDEEMRAIDADTLENIILADIQYYAQTAITDEKKLYDRLLSFSGQEWENEKAAQEKTLRDATNRISFIQDASKRLFEEKITGNVPNILFKNMLSDYEKEINTLEEKSENIRRQLQDQESSEANVQKWMELIKDCVSIDRLDRATAFQLIDNVAVHEQTDERGHRNQTIQIKYNFVGCLS